MTKITYTNDQQLINDAAQMLLEEHLKWSGSNEGMPSRDRSHVEVLVLDAYLEGNYAIEEWEKMSIEEWGCVVAKVDLLHEKAKQLADKKWEAAMTILGIEA